jgi:hypothetical protein
MFPRKHVRLGVIALLAIVSVFIVGQLLTADYPTHSDVFFMGVEAGVLATVLLVALVLIGFFLLRLTASEGNLRQVFSPLRFRHFPLLASLPFCGKVFNLVGEK